VQLRPAWPLSVASALAKAKRLRSGKPPVILFTNNPNAVRLGYDLTERMALIGTELFQAEAMESTGAFHHRLVDIARSRGVFLISIGSDTPVKVSRFNMDGSPVTLN